MSSKTRQILIGVLSGGMNSAALEANLTADFKGAFKDMLTVRDINILLKNPNALTTMFGSATALEALLNLSVHEIADSDLATAALAKSPLGIFTVVTNTSLLDIWQNTPANKARMQAQINATGSKLIRVVQTTAGSYNYAVPAGGLLAQSEYVNGGGGNGGSGSAGSNTGGQGGTGGEARTKQHTTSLPAGGTNLPYVVGAANATSSVTGYLTAAAGLNGGTSTATKTGPGTTSGTLYDSDPANAIWQPNTAVVKGADGGPGGIGGTNGSNGGAGITGAGGTAPYNPGTGLCSGGAGGGSYPSYQGAGSNASNPGCGAGGGGVSGISGQAGGTGAPGMTVIHGVLAA